MLAWLALLGLLGWGFSRVFLGYPARPVGVRTLAARELATARAAARVIYPEGGAIAASGESARVALHTDRFVGAQPASNRRLMRLLFFATEHATLVFPAPGSGGWRRFSSLGSDQQLAYLEGWRQSELPPRRLVFLSLRAIVTMGFFADASVLRSLGLAPREIDSPVIEADALWPAVGQHPHDIRFRIGDLTPPRESGPLRDDTPLHPDYR